MMLSKLISVSMMSVPSFPSSSKGGQRDLRALRVSRSGVVYGFMRALARHHPNPSSEEERLFPFYLPIQLISSPSAPPSRSALAASLVPPAPPFPQQQRKSPRRPVATTQSPPPPA